MQTAVNDSRRVVPIAELERKLTSDARQLVIARRLDQLPMLADRGVRDLGLDRAAAALRSAGVPAAMRSAEGRCAS